MTSTTTAVKGKKLNDLFIDNKKEIDNHKKASVHFEAAARCHQDAAKQLLEGNYRQACEITVEAHGHFCLAGEYQMEAIRSLTLYN